MTERDWTAKRNGAIYCAPACGGNCTWAAYQKAVKDSARLAEECGHGYIGRINENLGWHFGAISPCTRIYVYKSGGDSRYGALLGEPGSYSGRYTGKGETAKEAIAQAIAAARADMESIAEMLIGIAK